MEDSSQPISEKQGARLTRLLLVIVSVASLAVSMVLVMGWGSGAFTQADLVVSWLADGLVLVAWGFWWRSHWQVAASIPVGLFVLLGAYGAWASGLENSMVLFYVIAIVVAGMLLGRRVQWLVLGISLASFAVIGLRIDGSLPWYGNLAALVIVTGAFCGLAIMQVLHYRQVVATNSLHRNLFENSDSPMLLVNPNSQEIIDANASAAYLLATEEEALSGTRLSEVLRLVAGEAEATLLSLPSQASGSLVVRQHVTTEVYRDLEVTYTPIKLPEGQARYLIMQDVTSRVERERELEALASLAHALRNACTRQEVLVSLLRQVRAIFIAQAAGVVSRNGTGFGVNFEQVEGSLPEMDPHRNPQAGELARHLFESTEPYLVSPGETNATHGLPHPFPVMGVQLKSESDPQEAVWVGRALPFVQADLRLLQALAEMTAETLRRVALYSQTERRLQQLQSVHRVEVAIANSASVSAALRVLLEQAATQLGVDAADVLLYEPQEMSLSYAAGRGFRSEPQRFSSQRVGEGLAGWVAWEQRPLYLANVEKAPSDRRHDYETWRREGFVSYYGVPLVAKGEVKGVLELFQRSRLEPDPEWLDYLEIVAGSAAIALDNASLFEGAQRMNLELTLAYDRTLEGWARALELHDRELKGHSQRVTGMAVELARRLGFEESALVHVRRGALLHDIGKIAIPEKILQKAGPLSEAEWQVVRTHPQVAYDLLAGIPFLKPALDIPRYHHERWDGSGYPEGVKHFAIPRAARVFAIVDVWDALSHTQVYRRAWPSDKVNAYMLKNAGVLFEPQIVTAFLEMIRQEGYFNSSSYITAVAVSQA